MLNYLQLVEHDLQVMVDKFAEYKVIKLMRFCTSCGAKLNDENAAYCSACGQPTNTQLRSTTVQNTQYTKEEYDSEFDYKFWRLVKNIVKLIIFIILGILLVKGILFLIMAVIITNIAG